MVSPKLLSYHIGTVNDFHWGFEPVLSYSKPHEKNIVNICVRVKPLLTTTH